MAAADDWRIDRTSGEVWVVASGQNPIPAAQNGKLAPGERLITGANGRAALVRGEERVYVLPNSNLSVPEGAAPSLFQDRGVLSIEVEARPDQRFEVRTPFLAAVVKGTQFQVAVNERSAEVAVQRGQVEVTDQRSGDAALVGVGQTAAASREGRSGLSFGGAGPFPPIRSGTSPAMPAGTTPAGASPAAAPAADRPANGPSRGPAIALGPGAEPASRVGIPGSASAGGGAMALPTGGRDTTLNLRGSVSPGGESSFAGGSRRTSRSDRLLDPEPIDYRILAIPFLVGLLVTFSVATARFIGRRRADGAAAQAAMKTAQRFGRGP